MQIHEKLKVMRLCKNWSQEEMAEKTGYSLNGYAKIERGETDITIDKLSKIAEVLGIELEKLFSLNEKNIFNFMDNSPQGNIYGNMYLTETQCVHELEKSRLLLNEREKEIGYLKQEIERLKEIVVLLKEKLE